jgi:hypothetical protein
VPAVLEKKRLNGTPLRRERGGVYLFVVVCDNGEAVSKVLQQRCGSKEVERLMLRIGVIY